MIELIIGILSIYFSIVDYSNVYGPLAALVMLMFSIAVCSEAIYFGMYVIFECHIRRLIKIIKEKSNVSLYQFLKKQANKYKSI